MCTLSTWYCELKKKEDTSNYFQGRHGGWRSVNFTTTHPTHPQKSVKKKREKKRISHSFLSFILKSSETFSLSWPSGVSCCVAESVAVDSFGCVLASSAHVRTDGRRGGGFREGGNGPIQPPPPFFPPDYLRPRWHLNLKRKKNEEKWKEGGGREIPSSPPLFFFCLFVESQSRLWVISVCLYTYIHIFSLVIYFSLIGVPYVQKRCVMKKNVEVLKKGSVQNFIILMTGKNEDGEVHRPTLLRATPPSPPVPPFSLVLPREFCLKTCLWVHGPYFPGRTLSMGHYILLFFIAYSLYMDQKKREKSRYFCWYLYVSIAVYPYGVYINIYMYPVSWFFKSHIYFYTI